ncbi:uncharacterized protein LOC113335585 [Papaver somniferum]|uniref:uncharacterized protein LOC113335585 n=1 Tax=Papaver somniferum TaxID=3469 RepID=UPI000E70456D|nr:uncharacterized protein LOC113335585 [Papaver somniferum]
MVPEIQQFVSYTIKNGRSIRFWQDKWVDRGCLKDLFPIIYKACRRKQATIAEMINGGRWEGAFHKNLDANERCEWDLLRRDLGVVPSLVEENDEISFPDNFSAKTIYAAMENNTVEYRYVKFLWLKTIPNKVSFLLWAIFNDSLPTRSFLRHRGIELENDKCVFCNTEIENAEHLFLHCNFAFKIWDYFIKSFHISWPIPATVLQLFEAWNWNVLHGRSKQIWDIIHYALIWVI